MAFDGQQYMKEARQQASLPEGSLTAGVVILGLVVIMVFWGALRGPGEARPVTTVAPYVEPAAVSGTQASAASLVAETQVVNRGAVAFITGNWTGVPVAPTFTPPPPSQVAIAPVVVNTLPLGGGNWVVTYRTPGGSIETASVQVTVSQVGGTFVVSGGGGQ